jgi:glycosyltransferase involved in cell wall biosynthesis
MCECLVPPDDPKPTGNDAVKYSCAICTWNRCEVLAGTLERFERLSIPKGVSWELVVVNNNCSDDTDHILACFGKSLPIVRFFEPEQGIAHARNRAAQSASGDLLIFTDDDCRVGEQWLARYIEAAEAWPEATVFGGRIEPDFEGKAPSWIEDNLDVLAHVYGRCDRGNETRLLGPSESVLSGNMAVRTQVFKSHRFDNGLGRVRRERIGGEEIDFFRRLMRDEHKAVWVAGADVRHFIPKENQTEEYIARSSYGEGRTDIRLYGLNPARTVAGIPLWVVRRYLTARLALRFRAKTYSRDWLESFAAEAFYRGMVHELRLRRRGKQ